MPELIFVKPRFEVYKEISRHPDDLRRANPELARLIARSGDDAALLGPAHGDRLATQVRIVRCSTVA